jgi:serine phosphatase RsbU (regulator of sigma subunit)
MKKNKKLTVQTGLIISVMSLLMILAICFITSYGSRQIFLETNNMALERNLERYRYLHMNEQVADRVLNEWQLNQDVINDLTIENDEIYSGYVRGFLSVSSLLSVIDSDMLENTSGEDRIFLLKAMYDAAAARFDEERKENGYDSIYCVDVSDPNNIVLLMESSRQSEMTGERGLGTVQGVDAKLYSSAFEAFETEGSKAADETFFQQLHVRDYDTFYYMAYKPIIVDGTLKYILAIKCDWSDFARILNRNLMQILLLGVAVMLVTSGLIMLFIFRKAVKPLVEVNDGVREYIESKDSEAAVRRMSEIKARNEVGRLADSFSEMSTEIDRYTKEVRQLTGEKERAEAELNLAARIQSSMLPTEFPVRPELTLFASMDPAKEVGGDFYDFFFIDEEHLGLVIADVSGKGVPAALFMMMSKILLKNHAMTGLSPAEVLNRTNLGICENNRNNMFVTVWFGVLDIATGHVTAANAGHEYPMIRKPGGCFEIMKDRHGFVLGALRRKRYTEYEFDIEPGGTLFVYTDGAAEATDRDNRLFGTERMLGALNLEPAASPEVLLTNMKSAIDGFVGEAPQFDDLTMLCIKYNGKKEEER